MAKRKSTDKDQTKDAESKVDSKAPDDASESVEDAVTREDTAPKESSTEAADELTNEDVAEPDESDDLADAPKDDAEPVALAEPDTASDKTEGEAVDDHLSEEEAKQLLDDAENVDTVDATAENVDSIDADEVSPEGAIVETPPAVVQPEVIKETVVERKGGFFPMVVGGVVAAGLGYGTAAFVSQDLWPFQYDAANPFEEEMRGAVDEQTSALTTLTERVSTLEGIEPPVVDLSPVESSISEVQSTTEEIAARLDEFAARIDTLEKQPMEQAVSPEAIAAYERALEELQAEVETQRAEVSRMAEEAMAAEGNAAVQAQLAAARAALADVTTAIESGAGYADALGVLASNGVAVPDALAAHAEDGVATQGALIAAFPDAARSALSSARSAQTDSSEGTNRVASFFANQLGARSVEPREGDDPDAVLSRVEAAVQSGDLETALTEISALPEPAQAALGDWTSRAQARLDAKMAADALVQQLLQE